MRYSTLQRRQLQRRAPLILHVDTHTVMKTTSSIYPTVIRVEFQARYQSTLTYTSNVNTDKSQRVSETPSECRRVFLVGMEEMARPGLATSKHLQDDTPISNSRFLIQIN